MLGWISPAGLSGVAPRPNPRAGLWDNPPNPWAGFCVELLVLQLYVLSRFFDEFPVGSRLCFFVVVFEQYGRVDARAKIFQCFFAV